VCTTSWKHGIHKHLIPWTLRDGSHRCLALSCPFLLPNVCPRTQFSDTLNACFLSWRGTKFHTQTKRQPCLTVIKEPSAVRSYVLVMTRNWSFYYLEKGRNISQSHCSCLSMFRQPAKLFCLSTWGSVWLREVTVLNTS
jgi:hypothetical protein